MCVKYVCRTHEGHVVQRHRIVASVDRVFGHQIVTYWIGGQGSAGHAAQRHRIRMRPPILPFTTHSCVLYIYVCDVYVLCSCVWRRSFMAQVRAHCIYMYTYIYVYCANV